MLPKKRSSYKRAPPTKVAAQCRIVHCIGHRMFNLNYVAFIQFSCRPPDAIIEIMRLYGNYRKPPFAGVGSGWYVPEGQILALAKTVEDVWPLFATKLVDVDHQIRTHPETIACPSRQKDNADDDDEYDDGDEHGELSSRRRNKKKKAKFAVTKLG